MRYPVKRTLAVVFVAALTCTACQHSDEQAASSDPLTSYEPWAFTTCIPEKDQHRLLFVGGGVLSNETESIFTVDSVNMEQTTNLIHVASYVVPEVQGGGLLNSVVQDLEADDFAAMKRRGLQWPWNRRSVAGGHQIFPGQSAEIVAVFKEREAGPWRFSGIRTTYRDASHGFEHIAPASGTNDVTQCPTT